MKCYRCQVILIPKDQATAEQVNKKKYISEEHIIPNFCGGHLVSLDLLCAACNEILGTEIDGPLSRELLLARLFPITLDRGKQSIKFLSAFTKDSKKPVLVRSNLDGYKYHKPEWRINTNGELEFLRADNPQAALGILNYLSKQYPKINPEEEFKRIEWGESYLDERVNFDCTIGSINTLRAIAKIAVNFYLAKGGSMEFIAPAIEFVCNPNVRNKFVCFYYPIVAPADTATDEVSHLLYIKGDTKYQILYCYVELFNAINFMVVLNEDYSGPELSHTYCFDLLNTREINKAVNIGLFRNPISQINDIDIYQEQIQKSLSKKLDRAYGIIDNLRKPI
jgi:hypothetical protein